jgi:glycosyltransferase involved in cell wall biosynthesis
MKILVITHSYGLNGAATLLKLAMRHWTQSLGWEVDALINERNFIEYGDELTSIGVKPILEASIKTNYRLVLINTFIDIQYADLFFGKIPTALWMHEGASIVHHYPDRPIELLKSFSKPSVLIFQTTWQTDDIFRSFICHLPKSKIAIVPNGVDVMAPALPFSKLPSPVQRIINIGSLSPRKRQFDLAAATVNLSAKYPMHCSFVGDLDHQDLFDDSERRYLRDFPNLLSWIGPKNHEDTMQLLSQSDIFCFPSSDESFGLAPMEAALLNVPLILSDLPVYDGIGWIDGVNCLKFPVGDIASLERAIEKLILDPGLREKLTADAYRLAKTFSQEKFLNKLTHVLLAAASPKVEVERS